MKRVKYRILATVALLTLTVGAGQKAYSQGNVTYGGALTNMSSFTPGDLLSMSQVNYGFSTARSAAMGGAMTSLGGDLSSININPAGLGMYRSMAVGFTTDWNVTNSSTKYNYLNTSKTRYSLNNLGVVIPMHSGTGSLTGATFALSYSRLADFHRKGSFTLPSSSNTIADIFTAQLNGLIPYLEGGSWSGINVNALENYPFENLDIYTDEWGGVLGYLTYLNEPTGPNASTYYTNGISASAEVAPELFFRTKGYINEYSAAFGFNIRNFLYFGVTFAIQDILLERDVYFTETYHNNTSGSLSDSFRSMTYGQYSKMSAWGSNIKVGAIIRPVGGLRIGIAYHSPTWVREFTHDYSATMESQRLTGETHLASSSYVWSNYKFNSPSRLQTGISYTFGNHAIVSVDYEAVWYKSMKKIYSGWSHDSFNDFVKNNFATANNIRAGVEFKVTPAIALRAGYAYYGNAVANTNETLLYVASNRTQNISGGIGFRLSEGITLDLSYIYMTQRLKDYELYYLEGDNLILNNGASYSTRITTEDAVRNPKYTNHLISLSMNFMF